MTGSRSHAPAVPAQGWWLLAALALFWGCNWPVMKMVLQEWGVWHFRAVSLIFGTAGLFALAAALGHSLKVPAGCWSRVGVAALFNITGWHIFSGYGVALLASGRAAVVGYTMPLWVIPLSVLLLKEPMRRRNWVALGFGAVGLILLLGEDIVRMGRTPVGVLAMLAAALSWALGIVWVKRYPVAMPTTSFTGWMMLVGGIPVVIGAAFFGGFDLPPLSTGGILAMTYVVVVAMVFCHWAFMRLVGMLPATITGISSLIVPVVGVFSGMLFLGERPVTADWGALALICGALGVVLWPGGRRAGVTDEKAVQAIKVD